MTDRSRPADEAARLRRLWALDLLDTPNEDRFDRFTRLARRLFEVPIAAVSLVDDTRQWFKSAIGLGVPETPRELSFCSNVVASGASLNVFDAREDERFASNLLVLDAPYIRFYAGCPIPTPDGSPIGTLCIIDQVPREFSDQDWQCLRDLTDLLGREIAATAAAMADSLTGVMNRRGFQALTTQLLQRDLLGEEATLLFIDLDEFKAVNDTRGHEFGDRVLAVFAAALTKAVGDDGLVSRFGGDEFVVLLPSASPADAATAMSRLETMIVESAQQEMPELGMLGFSVGAVRFAPEAGVDMDELTRRADAQMYAAKARSHDSMMAMSIERPDTSE
jgi:diguanylate cyclase (GGDEF)-like protein